jgi:hypothetical protein
MNRRSRPIASEQAEVAKRDQNVSLGDVEETETSLASARGRRAWDLRSWSTRRPA